MDQTPAHERHNVDLLRLMPPDARRIVEVGCSSGALAREYKKVNPGCRYLGVEIEAQYAQLARRYCDCVQELDIESLDDAAIRNLEADCWNISRIVMRVNQRKCVRSRSPMSS